MQEVHAWLDARYEKLFAATFYDDAGGRSPVPLFCTTRPRRIHERDTYPMDDRGAPASWAFFSAKHMGAGQYYLMTITQRRQRIRQHGNLPAHRSGERSRDPVLVSDRL